MADVYKGLTIQFGADTRGLSAALKDVDKQSRGITSELKKVENALKFNPGNTELLRQKQELLGKQIVTTKERLEALREAEKKLGKDDIGTDQYNNLQREIIETGSKLEHLQKKSKETHKALEVPPSVVSGLKNVGKAAAAGAAAAAVALVGMGVAVLNNADELQRQADVTGLSAERLQELQYAGKNLGVELDTITGAQSKLTKAMAAAKDPNSKQADAFKKLGISATDSSGNLRDAKVVMGEAFDALSKVGNETERDALSMQLFGKSAMEMNPMITAGRDELARLSQEAKDNGAVMSGDAVAGLDTFGDMMGNIQNSLMGKFGEAFGQIIPVVTDFIDMIEGGEDPLDAFSITMAETFGVDVSKFVDGLRVVIDIVKQLAGVWLKAASAELQAFVSLGRWMAEIWAKVLPAIEAVWDLLKPFFEWAATTIKGTLKPVIDNLREAWVQLEPVLKVVGIILGVVIVAAIAVVVAAVVLLVVAFAKLVQGITWMVKTASKNFREFYDTAKSIFGKVADFIGEQVERIKGFFSNLVLKLPKIKLPHFKLTGEFSLKPPKVPSLNVDWYASGGSFAPGMPALVGVGDQRGGYEHILRDDQIVSLMQRAMGRRDSGQIVIQLNQPVRSYSETKRAVRDAMEEVAL